MKTCIFIIGTNGVGKTTLAKELIKKFGGVSEISNDITFCNDGSCCFAGRYDSKSKYGGVDALHSTSVLKDLVEYGLSRCNTIICEGSLLGYFGLNLTNAMFAAEKYIVVFLYAPAKSLDERLIGRSGSRINKRIIDKQISFLRSAKKWASIGVSVLSFDTSVSVLDSIVSKIFEQINKK